ncbi:MAG: T9SS type A sorting domain-containing protein [Saprospiraceae bacterium]|nr:T9SS type A sorting domain-containing protein [Saprospiraceae bacterium]
MKKNVLFLFLSLVVFGLHAQKIVTRINSPASLAGTKIFAGADFGADLSSGLWTADAILAEPLLACTDITNAGAMAGKIAVIERGICFFDEKALRAQQAGAIAVVIINHGDFSNRGGPPYTLFVAFPNIAAQVTIPCVMLGYDDNLALKAAFAAGQTVNISLGALPRQENDLSIYTNVLPNYSETYAFNPVWGAIPEGMAKAEGQNVFQPGGFFRNEGTATIDNANLEFSISRGGTEMFKTITNDNVSVEVDSIIGLLNTPYDLSNLSPGNKVGNYSIRYEVRNDKPDPVDFDNVYNTSFNITTNILSKSRFNTSTKAPFASQYWGGGTGYRGLMNAFQIRCGAGTTFDSLFTAIASNEPLAGMFVEGRIYKVNDLNGDNDITNDELELVAIGAYSFPNNVSGNFGTIRIGLDDLVGDPTTPYTVDSDDALYFMSIEYPGGANSCFMAYDVDLFQRQYFNYKNNLQELSLTDYPYISVNATDATTGGPDLANAGLFYIDANGDGTPQDQEIAFFAPSTSLEMNNYNPSTVCLEGVAVKDISDLLGVQLELSPNPTRDQINVHFTLPKSSAVQYQIIGMDGRVMIEKTEQQIAREFNSKINVGHLTSGTYIFKILTEMGYIKKSFVKMN